MADQPPRASREQMELPISVTAIGGLWFDTAIAQLRFAGQCCQQVAGCCQRVSIVGEPLSLPELVQRMSGGRR
jgi:hypothetical protein